MDQYSKSTGPLGKINLMAILFGHQTAILMATLADRTGKKKKKRALEHLVARAGSSPLLSPLLLSPSGLLLWLHQMKKGEDPQAFPSSQVFQPIAEASAGSVHE